MRKEILVCVHEAPLESHGAVAGLPLDRGADVNAQGGFCTNALQAASDEGHEALVQQQLDRDAEKVVHEYDHGKVQCVRWGCLCSTKSGSKK